MKWVKSLVGLTRTISNGHYNEQNGGNKGFLNLVKISPFCLLILQNGESHMVWRAGSLKPDQNVSNDLRVDREFPGKVWPLVEEIEKE
ncbi:hypothetical protein Dimus_027418, partial [Dionaea muscipula]